MSTSYSCTEPVEETLYQCRHILTDGRRCGSPSLRKEHFCYYHHNTRRPVPKHELESRRGMQGVFELPNPEDRSAIQHAIGQVLQRIAANELDPRRAGLLLYGLQIASLNLLKDQQKVVPEAYVEEVIMDPELGALAPQTEFTENHGRKGTAAQLLEKLQRERYMQQKRERETAQQAAVLPKVQAVAEFHPLSGPWALNPEPSPLRLHAKRKHGLRVQRRSRLQQRRRKLRLIG